MRCYSLSEYMTLVLPNAQVILGIYMIHQSKQANTKHHTGATSFSSRVSSFLSASFFASSFISASLVSTSAMSAETALDKVKAANKLVVAAVASDSTFFKAEGFMHGFGYDISRAYAANLGVDLDIKTYRSQAAALKAVKKGKANVALTTASLKAIEQIGLTPLNLSCGNDKVLAKNGLDTQINWSFPDASDPLAQSAGGFICQPHQVRSTKKLATFYNQNLMRDRYVKSQFNKAMKNRLPAYKASFKQHAKLNKHDWQLLVAMGYQESHLKANAVSPTGVKGLMMLTNNTARAMGVSNRVNPTESIRGGAKYLSLMKKKFKHVPNPDRLWFSLASYNMGHGAIFSIQRKLKAQGKNPNRWANVYQYMSENASRNSRYVQCMHYVTRIRTYLETLKQT